MKRVRDDAAGVTHDESDLRNAERLIEQHGADLRFVATWGKWLRWDGARWVLDDTGGALHYAAEVARVLMAEAVAGVGIARRELAELEGAGEDEEMKALRADAKKSVAAAGRRLEWAKQSQNANRLHSMVIVARTFPAIAVTHEQLDADPMLLNVQNGTIDLRTGELRPHRREDLITKLAPVTFDARATAPTWDAFLKRAMADDAELVDFVQRIAGYALSGDVREHVVGFFFGGGANGKSTFLSTLHAMLGDYASPAPRGLLFRSRGERHPTELASLHGRRFVTCSEVEEGQAFDEALVKDLTGGDPIECRRMREDFWTFRPTHKLFLAGNHKPTVRGDDEGIWRRMRLVPWTVTIPEAERDPLLPEKLRGELPGVLAWAVRGCLAWLAKGLETPASVRAATSAYREENDMLGQYFRLHVVFDADANIARRALRDSYEAFCSENGAEPLGAKRFAGRLRERGVREEKVRTPAGPRDGWGGVRLATDAELIAASRWKGRSDVATSSDGLPIPGHSRARAREGDNRELPATGPYVTTSETFAGYLEGEGIRGAE